MSWERILGHDRTKDVLRRSISAGRMPPALLLSGPDGVGKKLVAVAAARALLCDSHSGDACGSCTTCSRTERGLHPDLFVVEPETRAIKIEQVRNVVREVSGRPFEARSRAFVLDEAHTMTEQAANALLKSLEEPPASSHLILVTSAPQALLPTIRSRCQNLSLGPLPLGLLEGHLRDALALSPEEARLRALMSAGSLGRAVAFESEAYRTLRQELLGLLETSLGMDALQRMQAAERLRDQEDLPLALTTLRSLLRDLVVLRCGTGEQSVLNVDVAATLQSLAEGPLGGRAPQLVEAVREAQLRLRGNANKLLTLDLLMEAFAPLAQQTPA